MTHGPKTFPSPFLCASIISPLPPPRFWSSNLNPTMQKFLQFSYPFHIPQYQTCMKSREAASSVYPLGNPTTLDNSSKWPQQWPLIRRLPFSRESWNIRLKLDAPHEHATPRKIRFLFTSRHTLLPLPPFNSSFTSNVNPILSTSFC